MLGGSPEHAQRQPFLSLTSACPQGAALSSAPRPQVGFAGRRCPRYARGQAREPIPGSHTPAAGFQLALSVTELHWSLTASRVGRGTWGMWFSSSRHAQAPRDLWVTLFLLSVPWKPKSPPQRGETMGGGRLVSFARPWWEDVPPPDELPIGPQPLTSLLCQEIHQYLIFRAPQRVFVP